MFQEKFFPQASRKFLTVPNKSLWTVSTFDFLDTVAHRIEAKFARAEPRVVASPLVWEREMHEITAEIEQGKHARFDQLVFERLKLNSVFKGKYGVQF